MAATGRQATPTEIHEEPKQSRREAGFVIDAQRTVRPFIACTLQPASRP